MYAPYRAKAQDVLTYWFGVGWNRNHSKPSVQLMETWFTPTSGASTLTGGKKFGGGKFDNYMSEFD